jgi:hypothetical protein
MDSMNRKIMILIGAAVLIAGILLGAPSKPKSVIHVISVQWKAGVTQTQIDGALKAAETMNYPGLKNVWTKAIKMQLPDGYKNIIVMEFESEDALKKYADSDAQKKWYSVYMPLREESRTSDVTN